MFVYNRVMSQAKEDVAVTYVTYTVNQLLTETMSSNPQPQKKKENRISA